MRTVSLLGGAAGVLAGTDMIGSGIDLDLLYTYVISRNAHRITRTYRNSGP